MPTGLPDGRFPEYDHDRAAREATWLAAAVMFPVYGLALYGLVVLVGHAFHVSL